jgi:hypothetical protein
MLWHRRQVCGGFELIALVRVVALVRLVLVLLHMRYMMPINTDSSACLTPLASALYGALVLPHGALLLELSVPETALARPILVRPILDLNCLHTAAAGAHGPCSGVSLGRNLRAAALMQ